MQYVGRKMLCLVLVRRRVGSEFENKEQAVRQELENFRTRIKPFEKD